MLTKARKKEIVGELKEKLQRQKILIFSDFSGISVAKLQTLRRILKKDNAEYKVARKTMLARALAEAGLEMNVKELQGELGVVFGYGDEIIPAKSLLKFSKANETFKVLGGILNKTILGSKEIITLAKLPGKEMLVAQLLGVLQSSMRGLVTVLGGNIRNLAIVLNKIKDKSR